MRTGESGIVLVIIFIIIPALAMAESPALQASLEFTEVPEVITPGETFQVGVRYNTEATDSDGHRFLAVLRLIPRRNGAPYREVVMDNDGRGLEAPQGEVSFNTRVKASFFSNLFIEAYLAPFGMNDEVMEMVESYPTDGAHGYLWKGGSTGHTRDLHYLDQLLAGRQKDATTYCCGLTFEVFLRTLQEYNKRFGVKKIGDISFNEMKKVRGEWYGSRGDTVRQMVSVIKKKGLGVEITDKTRAKAGDFCMFWRHNGTGHSVIFIDWVRDSSGKISGLKYWSAQKSTNGIGYRMESIGPPKDINWDKIFIARLKRPRQPLEWEKRYATVSTSNPVKVRENRAYTSRANDTYLGGR